MQLRLVLTTLGALYASTLAAVVQERVPLIGSFGVSEQDGCPAGEKLIVQFAEGDGCGDCRTFYTGIVYKSIEAYSINQYCTLTVFQTPNCSDPGIQSGVGCWSPEGGIAGYKFACPYWPPPPESYVPGCNTD